MGKLVKGLAIGLGSIALVTGGAIAVMTITGNKKTKENNDFTNDNISKSVLLDKNIQQNIDNSERFLGIALTNDADIYSYNLKNEKFAVVLGATVNNIKQNTINLELTYNTTSQFREEFNKIVTETDFTKISEDEINNMFNLINSQTTYESLNTVSVLDIIKDNNITKLTKDYIIKNNELNEKVAVGYSSVDGNNIIGGASFWCLDIDYATQSYIYQCEGKEYLGNKQITYSALLYSKDPTPNATSLTALLLDAYEKGQIDISYQNTDILNYTLYQNTVSKQSHNTEDTMEL